SEVEKGESRRDGTKMRRTGRYCMRSPEAFAQPTKPAHAIAQNIAYCESSTIRGEWLPVAGGHFVKAILCSALFVMASVSLVLAQGTYTQIDVPGAIGTFLSGIDSAGDIVGTYYVDNMTAHGFLLSAGTITTLDYPGASYTGATGIND